MIHRGPALFCARAILADLELHRTYHASLDCSESGPPGIKDIETTGIIFFVFQPEPDLISMQVRDIRNEPTHVLIATRFLLIAA